MMKRKSIVSILLTSLLLFGQLSFPVIINADASSASLNVSMTPTKPEGYLLDPVAGIAKADMKLTVDPQGSIDSETRIKSMDLIFIIDISDSMDRGLLGDILGGLLGIKSKIDAAKQSVTNTINIISEKALPGDRFALISFNNNANEEVGFNGENQTVEEIKQHLENIDEKVQDLNPALFKIEKANYNAALAMAEEMFGESKNTKYVIFLTDGKPSVGPTEVIRNIDGYFIRQSCILFCKEEYIKKDNVKIESKWGDLVFTYNGKEYKYSEDDNLLDLSALDAASSLANKNVKIFAGGLGEWNSTDKQFLAELSELTGGESFTAKTVSELDNRLEHVLEVISQAAMKDIQLKINLKHNVSYPSGGHVDIQESSTVYKSEDGNYAIVNVPDIDYVADEGPPSQLNKIFTMEFDKSGIYSFNDVNFTYTDLKGHTQSESFSFTVNVVDEYTIGLKFPYHKYAIDVMNNMEYGYDDANNRYELGGLSSDFTINLKDDIEVIPIPGKEDEETEMPEELIWSSGNTNIVTVNSDGDVKATGLGSTFIEVADASNPDIRAITEVKVNLKAITFDSSSYKYVDGLNLFNKIIPYPSGFKINSEAFTWENDRTEILTVDDGGVLHRPGADDANCGFVILTIKLLDDYKIDIENEKVEAQTLVKVPPKADDDFQEPKKQW